MSSLDALVERIRAERGLVQDVPAFDPKNGNERARFLLVLEAPGPGAVRTGVVSFDNPDQTARNLRSQLTKAGIGREQIALWNVVPWYLGNEEGTKIRSASRSDIDAGLQYLADVVACIPGLKCIVLVGAAARQAHIHLSHHTTARILGGHHTSPKVRNRVPHAWEDNLAVFRFMLATST